MINKANLLIHNDINQSLNLLDTCIDEAINLNDSVLIVKALTIKGRALHLNQKSKNGMEYLNKAQNIALALKDSFLLTRIYDNKGLNYRNNFIYDSAEYFYDKAKKIADIQKDTLRLVNIYNNEAMIKRDIAANYRHRNKIKASNRYCYEALELLNKSQIIIKNFNDSDLKSEIHYLKFGIYDQMVINDKALENILVFEKYQLEKYGMLEPLIDLRVARLELSIGKKDKSIQRVQKIIEKLDSIDNSNKLINIYSEIQKFFFAIEEYEKSLYYLERRINIEDQVNQLLNSNQGDGVSGKEFYGDKTIKLDRKLIDGKKRLDMLNKITKQRVKKGNLIIYGFALFSLAILILLYFVFRQTNELNKLNQKLVGETELKQKLFGIITHDLKNPLLSNNYGLDFMKGLDKKNIDELRYKKYLNVMLDNSNQLIELTNNILDWSRSQTDQIIVNKSNFILEELINEAIDVYKLFAKNKNIEIICDIKVYNMFSDKKLLLIIVQNVLNNAIKYTPHNGTINIVSYYQNNKNILEISDTGVGIKKQYLDKLFDSRFNTSEIKNTDNKGTGLGLQVCREFVELIGGKISVNSKVNEGSTFRIELPI